MRRGRPSIPRTQVAAELAALERRMAARQAAQRFDQKRAAELRRQLGVPKRNDGAARRQLPPAEVLRAYEEAGQRVTHAARLLSKWTGEQVSLATYQRHLRWAQVAAAGAGHRIG